MSQQPPSDSRSSPDAEAGSTAGSSGEGQSGVPRNAGSTARRPADDGWLPETHSAESRPYRPPWLRRWWRSRPLAVQLSTALLLVGGVVGSLLFVTSRHWSDRRAVVAERQDALRQAELAATRLETARANMQSGRRGFLITQDSAFLGPYLAGQRRFHADIDTLAQLLRRDSTGLAELDHYASIMQEWIALPVTSQPHAPPGTAEAGRRRAERLLRVAADEALMDSARVAEASLLALIRQAAARESRLGRREMAAFEERARIISLLAVLVAILLVVFVSRVLSATLRDIVRGANALATGDHDGARAASGLGGSREARQLSTVFERLSLAIAEREQILQSDILQLKELELLKSDFISTVSHELRTPLTAIRGALGLVLGGATGPLAPKSSELLQIAQQNTHRLIRLINDILDIEKMEGGHLTVRTEPCDLAAVIDATIAGVRAVAEETGVRLRVDAPERPVVNGDPDRLVQVFTNLVSNAIKFSPAGREVRVQLSTSDSTAIVSVADQGPGIPAEFRDRIFGKFQQAEQSGTRTTGGTGLGLAIARAIVDLHGGSVRFETLPGTGTTFIVELPYAPPREVSLSRTRMDQPYLLIVEPEAATLDVLAQLCSSFAEVVAVRSTHEAISAAQRAAFDGMVVDPDVSGSRGLEFVRVLRGIEGHAHVPMLLYAARDYDDAELEPLGLTSRDVFVKTVHRERALVDRLRESLGSPAGTSPAMFRD